MHDSLRHDHIHTTHCVSVYGTQICMESKAPGTRKHKNHTQSNHGPYKLSNLLYISPLAGKDIRNGTRARRQNRRKAECASDMQVPHRQALQYQ